MNLPPPTGHIPLISSRPSYLRNKLRGGGGAQGSPSRSRSPSPTRSNAESPKGLQGEGVDCSGGEGAASRGGGDAAAAAAEMEGGVGRPLGVEVEEEVGRSSSTGATRTTGTVSSPQTTSTHVARWPAHPSSPPPDSEGLEDAQWEAQGPLHTNSSHSAVEGSGARRAELGRHQAAMAGAGRQASALYPSYTLVLILTLTILRPLYRMVSPTSSMALLLNPL